jgi:hypothetical protein
MTEQARTEPTNQTETWAFLPVPAGPAAAGPATEATTTEATPPEAAGGDAAPAGPKSTKKGGARKGARKGRPRGAKKAGKKATAGKGAATNGQAEAGAAAPGQATAGKGLRSAQVRIMEVLAGLGQGQALSKAEIGERARVNAAWVYDHVGRLDRTAEPGTWQTEAGAKGLAAEAKLFPSLLTLGLVRGKLVHSGAEGKGRPEAVYEITPQGRRHPVGQAAAAGAPGGAGANGTGPNRTGRPAARKPRTKAAATEAAAAGEGTEAPAPEGERQ